MRLPVRHASGYTRQAISPVYRMTAVSTDVYASAPLRRLLADEARGLMPELQRCRGNHGLLLTVAGYDQPPALPMLSCWTRLWIEAGRYGGDIVGHGEECLPFLDDAFELIILRHALEKSSMPQALLDEVMRVLSPGGLLVLSGFHPLSFWTPWLAWRTRRQSLRPHLPWQVWEWLRRRDMRVETVRRIGSAWPGSVSGTSYFTDTLGGAYVLLARKRRGAAEPVRLVPRTLRAPADVRLAPGARSNTA
jgi:SAM-dependent methyltransferase